MSFTHWNSGILTYESSYRYPSKPHLPISRISFYFVQPDSCVELVTPTPSSRTFFCAGRRYTTPYYLEHIRIQILPLISWPEWDRVFVFILFFVNAYTNRHYGGRMRRDRGITQ